MKVLITGGAGFIGLHLAQKFLADFSNIELHLLDNFQRAVKDKELSITLNDPRVKLWQVDLRDHAALKDLPKNFDYVFHFAAIIGVKHVLERPYEVLRENFLMLDNVVTWAKEIPTLKRFIFLSTSEIYAGTLKFFELPLPTPEDVPLTVTELNQARTSYMLSKIHGEALLQYSKLPFTIFRPHNVYGPRMGMSHVLPELMAKMKKAEKNQTIKIQSPKHSRAFCYIDDAVDLLVKGSISEKTLNQTLNLGNSEREVSIWEVAETVRKTVGRGDIQIEGIEDTPGSPNRRIPDMNKATALIGFSPKTVFLDGVLKTYQWYETNIFEGADACAL
jgi:UDP-glucose 4-epimerase